MNRKYFFLLITVFFIQFSHAMEEREDGSRIIRKEENGMSRVPSLKTLIAITCETDPFLKKYPELDVRPDLDELNGENYEEVIQRMKEKLNKVTRDLQPHVFAMLLNKEERTFLLDNNQKIDPTKLEESLILFAANGSKTFTQCNRIRKIYADFLERYPAYSRKQFKHLWKRECTLYDVSWRGQAKHLSYPIAGVVTGLVFGFIVGRISSETKKQGVFCLVSLFSGFVGDKVIEKIADIHHKDKAAVNYNHTGTSDLFLSFLFRTCPYLITTIITKR